MTRQNLRTAPVAREMRLTGDTRLQDKDGKRFWSLHVGYANPNSSCANARKWDQRHVLFNIYCNVPWLQQRSLNAATDWVCEVLALSGGDSWNQSSVITLVTHNATKPIIHVSLRLICIKERRSQQFASVEGEERQTKWRELYRKGNHRKAKMVILYNKKPVFQSQLGYSGCFQV